MLIAVLSGVVGLFIIGAAILYRSDKYLAEKMDKHLTELEREGFSGMIHIESNGEVLLSKAYGNSTEPDRPMKVNQGFSMGSLVKLITATGILKLELEERISLSDKLSKYFDNVPQDKQGITLMHLLEHTSGLVPHLTDDYTLMTDTEVFEGAMKADLVLQPGQDFSYSNVGYSILGMVIEKVTEMPYEEYVWENFLASANMHHTGYSKTDLKPSQMVTGYFADGKSWGNSLEKPWLDDGPSWNLRANGGMLTTMGDLRKLIGIYENDQILGEQLLNRLQDLIFDPNPFGSGYTLGEAGGNGIFNLDIQWNLNTRSGVIMMSNKEQFRAEDILTDSFLGIKLLTNLMFL